MEARPLRRGLALAGFGALAAATITHLPPAGATVYFHHVHSVVAWTGTSCISYQSPMLYNPRLVGQNYQCDATGVLVWDQDALPGDLIGVDPNMGANSSIACSTAVDGIIVMQDSGYAGDGHDITCLGRL